MEMNGRDVIKRGGGTNRFSNKQSGSAESKKGMLKKLGLTDEKTKSSYSDLENEISRKFSKLPNKNNNGVDHASVPRKLRSAMKKRNLESVSKLLSVSKRLNRSKTGIESCNKDLVKKENQEMEAKAIGPESMVISNDEKEVAETLYGLAGMFIETDKKSCVSLSDAKDTSKSDTIVVGEADLPKSESLKPVVTVLSLAKTNHFDEMPLDQSGNQLVSKRLMESSSANLTDVPARANEAKVVTGAEYNCKGLALWRGLSSNSHSGAHVSSKPSSTTIPLWMGQAASPSKTAPVLSEPLRVQPRKLKRCASHINICHFIKELQTRKSSPATLNQIEQRSSELSERRLPDPVTTISDYKTTDYPSKRYQNPHLLDIHRMHNPKPVLEDMTKLALEHYGPPMSQKQSYDFLSHFSAGATQSQFVLQNSFTQYHISASHSSQLSPATSSHQVQQLSPYQASRIQTAYNANQQQQQQLQKRLWAAQYRPTSGNTMPSNQYSNKPNLSLNLTSIQPLHVASSPRYNNNVSQQQHRLMAAAAAMSTSHHHNNNPSRAVMNRQEHHYPLIYEDTRTPLQLLCNEQS